MYMCNTILYMFLYNAVLQPIHCIRRVEVQGKLVQSCITLINLLWQVLVNDLKWSPGRVSGSCASLWRPRDDCTNYCYVNRDVIGLYYAGLRGKGQLPGVMNVWIVYCVTGRCGMG